MTQPGLFSILESELEQLPLVKINGRVAQVVGLVAESQEPDRTFAWGIEIKLRTQRCCPLDQKAGELLLFAEHKIRLVFTH